MRIGVDNDDVLFEFIPGLLNFLNGAFGTKRRLRDVTDYKLWNLWSVSQEYILRLVNDYYFTEQFRDLKPIEGAMEGLETLLSRGHTISVISSRPDLLETLTRQAIEKYFPGMVEDVFCLSTYDIVGGKKRSKAEVCKELGAEVMIDDALQHVKDCARNDIRAMLFDYNGTYPWNKDEEISGVRRVRDWREVVNYIR